LEEVLDIVKGGSTFIAQYALADGRTHAVATAMLLYQLAKQAHTGVPPQQQEPVRQAIATLTDELTTLQQISTAVPEAGSAPESFLSQLEPKELALCAWSTSQLYGEADVQLLCTAIMQYVLQSRSFLTFQWEYSSQLLYGLTNSGIEYGESRELQQLLDEWGEE
jgi:hypothetical protein